MSTKFLDDNNVEWEIHLLIGKIKQINLKLGLDLLAPWDGKVVGELTKDMFRFAEIMTIAIDLKSEEEANKLAAGLRGEAIDRAILAFWKDLSYFFVGTQRLAFQTLIGKTFEMWNAIWSEGIQQMTNTSVSNLLSTKSTPETLESEQMNRATIGNFSTKCGVQPESNPGNSPGMSTDASFLAGDAIIGNLLDNFVS